MTDPYKILGISRTSSIDEINTAYRNLVKKYHPDKYVGNPLSDLAAEKIKEINEAYDRIMDERKNGNSNNNTNNNSNQSYGTSSEDFDSQKIRMLIRNGQLTEAERLLNNATIRNAEWHFLMGAVFKSKGWYDMAYQHFDRANSLDPANMEYRQAKDSMDFSGNVYRTFGNDTNNNVACCDSCQTLICADCCCEMCGCNLIPCIGCR